MNSAARYLAGPLTAILAFGIAGCSVATRQAVVGALAAPPATPANTEATPVGFGGTTKLMLFGGSGHKVYLGCLNCSEFEADSVKNEFGPHGSAYATESIFNHYGSYGSPYSNTSACSEYASDPPVIVDSTGKYYGRLTLNRYQPELGAGEQLMGWLAAVCR